MIKAETVLGQVKLLEGICSLQQGRALSRQLALTFTEFTQVIPLKIFWAGNACDSNTWCHTTQTLR